VAGENGIFEELKIKDFITGEFLSEVAV